MGRKADVVSPEQLAARLNTLRGPEDVCGSFVRKIPEFFEDRLTEPQLADFLAHYDTCGDCREELTIQFLIREGLARLESGQPFNLQRELDEFVQEERRHLIRRRRLSRTAFAVEFLTIAAFAAAVIFYLMNFIVI